MIKQMKLQENTVDLNTNISLEVDGKTTYN